MSGCPITTNAGREFAKALGVPSSVHEFDCDSIAAIEAQAREAALRDAMKAVMGCHLPLGMDLRLDLARSQGLHDAGAAIRALDPDAPTLVLTEPASRGGE